MCSSYVWKTIYENDFCSDKFLYHYTGILKAFKILHGNQLKFSKLSLMNDTLESKPRLNTNDKTNELSMIISHFSYTNNNYIQLLCMSQDSKIKKTISKKSKDFYEDFSGRGFALPRMWAQYAENNNGVCFIFDKSKLTFCIEKQLKNNLILSNSIDYVSNFKSTEFNQDVYNDFLIYIDQKKDSTDQKNIYKQKNKKDCDFLKNHLDFVMFNYFTKLDDWKNENEYRFLAYGKKEYYVPNIFDSIVGIVVGEKIEDSNLTIIKLLCPKRQFEIMKIHFNCNGCKLTEVPK